MTCPKHGWFSDDQNDVCPRCPEPVYIRVLGPREAVFRGCEICGEPAAVEGLYKGEYTGWCVEHEPERVTT